MDVRLNSLDGVVALEVRDDGEGIGESPEGLGRRIMANRAKLIGARLTVAPAPLPKGPIVTCIFGEEANHAEFPERAR